LTEMEASNSDKGSIFISGPGYDDLNLEPEWFGEWCSLAGEKLPPYAMPPNELVHRASYLLPRLDSMPINCKSSYIWRWYQ
jgi:hypothetical protein